MRFSLWMRKWQRSAPAARRRTQTSVPQRASFRPRLEALEDRVVPSHGHGGGSGGSGGGSTYTTAATTSQLIADINHANTVGGTITINLQPHTTFNLTRANNATNGTNGLPVIGGTNAVNLTINGNGDTIERDAAGSSYMFRLLDVAQGASLTLDHVKLQNGDTFSGGAIYNDGTLTVNDCTISGNGTGETLGGGIYNDGTLMVSGCTISGNEANFGGGIFNASPGTATVISTTVSRNQAIRDPYSDAYFQDPEGGGIYNQGTLTVSGCTVSRNDANYDGGGIFNDGTLTVENASSISGNTAGDCGADVYNLGILYLDSTSTIGKLDGNPADSI